MKQTFEKGMYRPYRGMWIDGRMGNIDEKLFIDPPLPNEDMRVPDEILHSVVFMGVKKDSELKLAGTGFFVAVPTTIYPKGAAHNYLVTAKHVIIRMQQYVDDGYTAFSRINLINGNYHDLPLKDLSLFLYHPDEPDCVDVAVRRVGIDEQKAQFLPVSKDIFLSHSALRNEWIGIGDEVFFPGLFHPIPGEKKNIPIVRIGNIAMMPDGKEVYSQKFMGKMHSYLVEARSIGGLSGSPVFVRPSNDRFYGFGLVHGHCDMNNTIDEDILLDDSVGSKKLNTGIAIVTPAQKILETLMQPTLEENRRELEQKGLERTSSTLD